MDSEIWSSLLSATKRRLALHSYRSDRTQSHDDLASHDDMQIEFTCPFCTGEFDIGSLCLHIKEEHCSEPKAAVCPVCSAKVKNDMVSHITFEHGHLLKMQCRGFRVAMTSVGSILSSIIKERGVVARQMQSSDSNCWFTGSASGLNADPLANVLCDLPLSEGRENTKPAGDSLIRKEYVTNQVNSSTFCTSEESKKQLEADTLRASFVKHLVLSTMFREA